MDTTLRGNLKYLDLLEIIVCFLFQSFHLFQQIGDGPGSQLHPQQAIVNIHFQVYVVVVFIDRQKEKTSCTTIKKLPVHSCTWWYALYFLVLFNSVLHFITLQLPY